jgi:hypothetical protein
MRLLEAVKYCQLLGFKTSRQGLTYIIKEGRNPCFVKSKIRRHKATIYGSELQFYVESMQEQPPKGWVWAEEVWPIIGMPRSSFYWALKMYKIPYQVFGRGRGRVYVRLSNAKEYAERYRERNQRYGQRGRVKVQAE